jgi:DNA-binding response OmpR family regulator
METMPHVTIIEDESDIAGLLAHCFACEGFQVSTAGDGQTGLELVRLQSPDLIVLDLLLPSLSGWEVFRSLKASPENQKTPVIILSANSDVKDRINLLEAGVDDYIVKPCSVREVIARSRAVLRRTGWAAATREGIA